MFKKLYETILKYKFLSLISGSILLVIIALLLYSYSIKGYHAKVYDYPEKQQLAVSSRPQKSDVKTEIIRVTGSNAVVPLFRSIAREFERKYPNYKVAIINPGHTKAGIMGVVGQESDIGLMSRDPKPDEEKHKFYQIPLARDGIAFAVHSGVKINDLSTSQIQAIYTGRITNWKAVGGEDAEIEVLDRPEHSSAKILLRKTFLPPELEITPDAIIFERPEMMPGAIEHTVNSIGYTSFGALMESQEKINVISVNHIFPTPANVQKRIYACFRTFSLAVSPDPPMKVMQFFDFIFSQAGNRVIEKNGYFPISMELVIATIPEQNILKQESRYRPLVEYLKEKLGAKTKIRLQHLPSYEDVVSEFINGNVNAAFFGSMTYGIVQAKLGALAIARPEKDGISQYRGLILTRADSGIRKWQDLKGKSFSMIKATTAADLFPRLFLKRHGVARPEAFLGRIHYAAGHDASIELILNKKVAAGAAKDLMFEKMAATNPRLKQELVVIARSAPVPENALVIRRDLDNICYICHFNKLGQIKKGEILCDAIKRQLQEILLNLDETPEGQAVLTAMGVDLFLPTTDKDYQNLYEMTRELGIDLAQYPLHRTTP